MYWICRILGHKPTGVLSTITPQEYMCLPEGVLLQLFVCHRCSKKMFVMSGSEIANHYGTLETGTP
jgi:hypothetical protein